MLPILIPLYGDININSYGIMIAIGFVLCLRGMIRQAPAVLTADAITNTTLIAIAGGVIGGRILFVATEYHTFDYPIQAFFPWIGGYSLLGAVIGIVLAMYCSARYQKIPYLLFMDLLAANAGILQGFSRIGCFLAGCCGGMSTTCLLALNGHHPTQLYSALIYFIIFSIMQYTKKFSWPRGMRIVLYCGFIGVERFSIDFLRIDRTFYTSLPYFSINQWIALGIIGVTILLSIYLIKRPERHYESF